MRTGKGEFLLARTVKRFAHLAPGVGASPEEKCVIECGGRQFRVNLDLKPGCEKEGLPWCGDWAIGTFTCGAPIQFPSGERVLYCQACQELLDREQRELHPTQS